MLLRTSFLFPVLLTLVAGCGEKGPPPGAPIGTPSPVHGKVTLPGGTPMKGGVVNFYPVESESGGKLRYDGGSLVDAKGEYTAGRNGDGKGLVPGEYIVTVGPRELGELPGSNSNTVPQAYREKKTSTLKITVAESDNKIDIVVK
ncbi:MAG: hypothetical protein J0I06_25960 [Planctomycetes bacterium]|nr:hypothetical protein [Planctomycetota bacterium]